MKRRILVVFTALGLLLGVGATAAQASYSDCTDGAELVCMWTSTGGDGTRYSVAGVSGFCSNITAGDNTADSFMNNRSSKHVQFYQLSNCQGYVLCRQGSNGWINCPGSLDNPLPAGTTGDFLRTNAPGGGEINHRNKASSVFFNTG